MLDLYVECVVLSCVSITPGLACQCSNSIRCWYGLWGSLSVLVCGDGHDGGPGPALAACMDACMFFCLT